ncbi:MAG: PIG-L deacetylase family protein, partial [Bacteroidales bacterium]|nr:PIG-L deacetylase family protein [Bacteroidales bacterium]
MKKVLVVAPHPDDETLGCGGTLLKHKNSGDKIFWMIVTNIQSENGWSEEEVQKRQKEINQVSAMYGFEKIFKLDFPTTMLDTIPYSDLITKISAVIQEIKPSIVYIPNHSDVHTDHQVTFKATISCCKSFRAPFIRKMLMYECLSETEFAPALRENVFIPNVFIDISEYLNRKLEIMKIYDSEVMDPPFPRSMETVISLAKYRGSRIGEE